MSVFLRWGVFGILSVAALLYAYNASKDLANRRPPPKVAVPASAPGPAAAETEADAAESSPAANAACEVEVAVAQRAIEARDAKEPLDRLLRIREIAFLDDEARRERLAGVARRWFAHPDAIGPFSVRRIAADECAANVAPPAVTTP